MLQRESFGKQREDNFLHSYFTRGSYSIPFCPKLFKRILASVQPPEVNTAQRWYVSDSGHTCINPLIHFNLPQAKRLGTLTLKS